jgi:MFS transporter, DHA1 family, multidrug resistance protein
MTATLTPPETGRRLGFLLLLLTVFAPISMDLYLPVLPALTGELGAGASAAQLTLTACLLGLAVGQLVAGPLSDRFGRRTPLLIGLIAYIAASALCALSPSIETLILARLVQGLAGAVGIVISQASGRDVYSGSTLLRFYGRVTVLGGLAAVIGPFLGGQLARITDWRGVFLILSGLGALILAATLMIYRETLPPDSRTTGGWQRTVRDFRVLFCDRVFVGAVLVCGFSYAALFAYLSGATYVLQEGFGLSPQGYALAFGVNAAGFMLFGWLGGRGAERFSVRGTLVVGVGVAGLGSLGLLGTGLAGPSLPLVLVSLFVLSAGVALSATPASSLALRDYPQMAGTASSVLGCARFGFGGIAAPLVGLGGAGEVLPLALVAVGSLVLAALALPAACGRGGRAAR